MSDAPNRGSEPGPRLREMDLRPSYSSGTDDILNNFYVPALARARRYDRIAGYFRSSSFVSAAAGIARFVNRGGTMRLIVGVKLTEADCAALRGEAALDEVLARQMRAARLNSDDVARERLQVIAWLVREDRLEMRVGVPCDTDGRPLAEGHPESDGRYFHLKSGILYDDSGDAVVFRGSVNESKQGWQLNYEELTVYPSWKAESFEDYGKPEQRRFERLWEDRSDPGWLIVPLGEAARRELLDFVSDDFHPPRRDPAEDHEAADDPQDRLSERDRDQLEEIRQAPLSRTGVGLASAAVEPWPHQLAIARRVVDTWPRSYLLADQVGLGKTIEIGLVLREVLLSGRARTALILVPASVLIQWQQELHEKFSLDIPRLDGGTLVFSSSQRRRPVGVGSNPWHTEPVLLASSHLARRRAQRAGLLEGPGWDLVVLDEAHHARRGGSKPDGTPNHMLAVLGELQRRKLASVMLLASATPMQMHPHELWDLLSLFGLAPEWARRAEAMQRYYEQFNEPFAARDWDRLQRLVKSHLSAAGAPSDKRTAARLAEAGPTARHRIESFAMLGLNRPAAIPEPERAAWDEWLRACTPVRDRVFRTTRSTLRAYKRDGLLPATAVIPDRAITDCFEDLGEAQELYERIDDYITTRYLTSVSTGGARGRALGFIMTVYRRRLTSSLFAIRRSLERRREVLHRRAAMAALLDDDDRYAAEGDASEPTLDFDDPDPGHVGSFGADPFGDSDKHAQRLGVEDRSAELAALERFIDDLEALPPDEPKMRRLSSVLKECFEAGHPNAVIFTQYADTLHYIRKRLLHTYRNGLACYYGGKGEIWDDGSERWTAVTKEHIKTQFRSGQLQILIGTDSMSEGLNLQTCAVMVNFDLPWNFVRVEQRIGRLDRIGGKPRISVHNLYYRNTVEVDIFTRLQERFGSFEAVLGHSAPVLSSLEGAVLDAAMGTISGEQAAMQIEASIDAAQESAVSVDDLDAVPEPADELAPAMTLEGLRYRLLSVPAAAARLAVDPGREGVWLLSAESGPETEARVPVTFDLGVCADNDDVVLLTWGSPLLDELLESLDR